MPANWAYFRGSTHTGYIGSKRPLFFLLVDSTCWQVGTYLVVSKEVDVFSHVWIERRIPGLWLLLYLCASRVLQRLTQAWTDLKWKCLAWERLAVLVVLFPSVSQTFLSLTTKQKFVVYSFVFGFVSHLFFEVKHSLVIVKVTLA